MKYVLLHNKEIKFLNTNSESLYYMQLMSSITSDCIVDNVSPSALSNIIASITEYSIDDFSIYRVEYATVGKPIRLSDLRELAH